MQDLHFTDEEIRVQLEAIGFNDISDQQLKLFREDLERLLQEDVGKSVWDDKNSRVVSSERSEYTSNASSACSAKNHVLQVIAATKIIWQLCQLCTGKRRIFALAVNVPTQLADHLLNSYSCANIEKLELPKKVNRLEEVFNAVKSKDVVMNGTGIQIAAPWTFAATEHLRPIIIDTPSEDTQSVSTDSSVRRRKRKVLRYRNGRQVVCDETAVRGSSGDESHISPVTKTEKSSGHERAWKSTSDLKESCQALFRTKSVILPNTRNPQLCLKRDPVALYQYYKRQWAQHKMPGDDNHSELRWNIRRMMSSRH